MHEDITKFIEAYRDSVSHGPRALTAFYAEPCVTASTAAVRVSPASDDTALVLAEVHAANRARGFTHVELRAVDIHPLGSSSALATVRWAYKGACDELLWTTTISYNLYRRDGVWKILVQTIHDM